MGVPLQGIPPIQQLNPIISQLPQQLQYMGGPTYVPTSVPMPHNYYQYPQPI